MTWVTVTRQGTARALSATFRGRLDEPCSKLHLLVGSQALQWDPNQETMHQISHSCVNVDMAGTIMTTTDACGLCANAQTWVNANEAMAETPQMVDIKRHVCSPQEPRQLLRQ